MDNLMVLFDPYSNLKNPWRSATKEIFYSMTIKHRSECWFQSVYPCSYKLSVRGSYQWSLLWKNKLNCHFIPICTPLFTPGLATIETQSLLHVFLATKLNPIAEKAFAFIFLWNFFDSLPWIARARPKAPEGHLQWEVSEILWAGKELSKLQPFSPLLR